MKKKLVKSCLISISAVGIGYILKNYITDISNTYEEEKSRYISYYYIIQEWMFNKQKGKTIENYLEKNNINNIAIYGMGTLGKMLYDDIKNTNIKISYIIDKTLEKNWDEVPIINLKDIKDYPMVDAIIITPIYNYVHIIQEIKNYKINFLTISLEQLIL